MDNFIQDKNYNFDILSKYTCIQNIDRIKFFKNENNTFINAISTGYHLIINVLYNYCFKYIIPLNNGKLYS